MTREQWREEGFAFGEVTKEAVYLTPNREARAAHPDAAAVQEPRQRGHLRLRARPLPAAAGRGGRCVHPHRDLRDAADRGGWAAASSACARATRAAARTASRSATSSPGTDIKAQATVLAEGCWGHLTGAAIRSSTSPNGREPQVWELGVKEVWKVPKPLDRLIHTMGPWPLKISAEVRPDRRHLDLSDEEREDRRGSRLDRLRRRARVRRRDDLRARPAADVQDPPARARDPRGRRARRVGRQGAARRRLLVDAEALDARRGARRRRRRHGRHDGRSRASTTASSRACSRPSRSTRRSSAAAATSPTTRR